MKCINNDVATGCSKAGIRLARLLRQDSMFHQIYVIWKKQSSMPLFHSTMVICCTSLLMAIFLLFASSVCSNIGLLPRLKKHCVFVLFGVMRMDKVHGNCLSLQHLVVYFKHLKVKSRARRGGYLHWNVS